MADIPYVCLYASYLESLSPFTDEECGRLIRAMLNYAATGEMPLFEGNERFIWPSLQAQIDRDIETYQAKCARNKANGSKGGRPPKNQTVIPETERFFEKPKKPKEKEKEKESIGADKPPKPTRHKYGEYKNVLLSDEELAKLQNEIPCWQEMIERLSNYIESTGKKYKNHLATMRNWYRDDLVKGKGKNPIPNYGGEDNWSL